MKKKQLRKQIKNLECMGMEMAQELAINDIEMHEMGLEIDMQKFTIDELEIEVEKRDVVIDYLESKGE